MRDNLTKRLYEFFKAVVLLDLGLALLIFFAVWVMGWRLVENFAAGLFMVGTVVAILGTLSFTGSSGREGYFDNQYKYTENSESHYQRLRQNIELLDSSYNFTLFTSVAGGLLILLSFLIS